MPRQELCPAVLVGKSILLREGLARILNSAKFRVLASVSCADDLRLSKALPQPPLVLILHTGDDFDDALEQIAFFKEWHPDGRIAVVAERYRLDELVSAFRAGVQGYFVNIIACDRFIKSVELVMMGETIVPPALLSVVLDPQSLHLSEASPSNESDETIVPTEGAIVPSLSPREKLILRYLIEGDSNKCIARKIDITEATVKVHVKAILRKIRVQNRTQAAIWGMNHESLMRPVVDRLPSSSSQSSKQSRDALTIIRLVEQVGGSAPPSMLNCELSHLNGARIERLMPRGLLDMTGSGK